MGMSSLMFVGMDGKIGHDEYDYDDDVNENHNYGYDYENDVPES
jgi:hypothetical protein